MCLGPAQTLFKESPSQASQPPHGAGPAQEPPVTGGEMPPREVGSQHFLAHVALGVLSPNFFLTTCYSAPNHDPGGREIKDTHYMCSLVPLLWAEMPIMHRKKSSKENLCNGGSLWVVSLGEILF